MTLTIKKATELVNKVNRKPSTIGTALIACGLGIDIQEFWRAPSREGDGWIEWQFEKFRIRENFDGCPRLLLSIDGDKTGC